jgi:hypothetical protein
MSAAATIEPTEPTTKPAATDWPGHATHVLSLVRRLIDYAKDLVGTFQQPGAITRLADHVRHFGTAEIALILARITSGLLRAEALEARLVRIASQPDAEPKPAGASPPRTPRAGPAAPRTSEHPFLANLPSPERIAAEVSRRPIGVVIADICRDLGITPNHPLWQELCVVIRRHGGNVATLLQDIFRRVFRVVPPATVPTAWPALPAPRPATGCTGPPRTR